MSLLPTTKQDITQNTGTFSYVNKSSTMDHDNFSWLTAMGFAFLTFNSGMAIYRSNGDTGSVAFVAISYLDLLLLFYFLRLYERAPQNSPRRQYIKVAVWCLTTLLTVMFSHKVAALMPLPVAIIVWLMAAATISGGFYAFFIHRETTDEPNKQ